VHIERIEAVHRRRRSRHQSRRRIAVADSTHVMTTRLTCFEGQIAQLVSLPGSRDIFLLAHLVPSIIRFMSSSLELEVPVLIPSIDTPY
jgi:hypothetical protein